MIPADDMVRRMFAESILRTIGGAGDSSGFGWALTDLTTMADRTDLIYEGSGLRTVHAGVDDNGQDVTVQLRSWRVRLTIRADVEEYVHGR